MYIITVIYYPYMYCICIYRGWNAVVIDATMPVNANGDALVDALLNICEEAAEAVQGKYCHRHFFETSFC